MGRSRRAAAAVPAALALTGDEWEAQASAGDDWLYFLVRNLVGGGYGVYFAPDGTTVGETALNYRIGAAKTLQKAKAIDERHFDKSAAS